MTLNHEEILLSYLNLQIEITTYKEEIGFEQTIKIIYYVIIDQVYF